MLSRCGCGRGFDSRRLHHWLNQANSRAGRLNTSVGRLFSFAAVVKGPAWCDARWSMSASSYEQLRAEHRWDVTARYNIASDVCEKHPRDKPAMVWESFDGSYRELAWVEL